MHMAVYFWCCPVPVYLRYENKGTVLTKLCVHARVWGVARYGKISLTTRADLCTLTGKQEPYAEKYTDCLGESAQKIGSVLMGPRWGGCGEGRGLDDTLMGKPDSGARSPCTAKHIRHHGCKHPPLRPPSKKKKKAQYCCSRLCSGGPSAGDSRPS